ncbi:MAG: hypothetical protein KA248_03515 [Kiritimatiellae bacterium]|nr:hypothetical protein [Kiritimatiellia bacterium]
MNRLMKWMGVSSLALVALVFSAGCAAFRASTTDVNVEDRQHFGSTYDYTDMRFLTEEVANELLASPFLNDQPQPPIMMIAGVQNRTMDHRDLKALTDRIRTMIIQAGKAQFVNESRREELLKEQGYQAAHATAETQTAIGRQLGAKYMLTGSLIEMEDRSKRQVRVSKQQRNYYKLTIEITDLETGLISWTTEKEFARQASLPLIGW